MRLRLLVLFLIVAVSMAANVIPPDRYMIDPGDDAKGDGVVAIIAPVGPGVSEVPEGVTATRAAVQLSGIPASMWAYGCSATSAAMYAGYFDRLGLSNIYTGPTNGGVFPLPGEHTWSSNTWPRAAGGTSSVYNNPLSATFGGIDGQSAPVHVDDFWVGYGYSGNDPIGAGTPHTYADCTADFMGTNQDYWNSSDGSTSFYWPYSGSRLYDFSATESDSASTRRRDGAHGFRLFLESRGYDVYTNFNQYITGYNGYTPGISFADYCEYIDAGIPVLLHVSGHTMLANGYDTATNTVYIYDTWGFTQQSMTWGGSYSSMAHYGMTVVVTESPTYVTAPYSDGFEGGYPCTNWRLLEQSDAVYNDFSASAANTGVGGLEMTTLTSTGYSSTGGTDLASMWTKAQYGAANYDFTQFADIKVNLGSLSVPTLQFDYRMGYMYAAWWNNFWVLLEDQSGTWHQVFATQPTSSVAWNTQAFDLSAYAGQNVRLRFFHNGEGPPNYCHIDNLSIYEGAAAPTLSATDTPSAVLYHRAQCGGNISDDGGLPIQIRGLCWDVAPNTPYPVANEVHDNLNQTGAFSMTMLELTENTTYNVRSYAGNAMGTSFGPTVQFTTPPIPEDTGTSPANEGEVLVPNVAASFYFTGVVGASGNDITVDDLDSAPSNPGAAYLAAGNTGDFSVVITNNTGFTFTNSELRFNVDDLDDLAAGGIDQDHFLLMNNGDDSGVDIWRRDNYGEGDFTLLANLLYHDNNGINGDFDDYLYTNVAGFSEFAFSSNGDHPLPVTLSSFSAACTSEGAVQLDWVAQTETDAAGYNVLRNVDDGLDSALLLTPELIPAANQSQPTSYRYVDIDVENKQSYSYWLEGVDMDGATKLFGPVRVTVTPPGDGGGEAPAPDLVTALQGAFPNPFNPSTTLQYTLAEDSHVRLAVYNLRGQLVRRLDEGVRSEGEHRVAWDGLDAAGAPAGSGVYLFRLEAGNDTYIRKGVLMK